MRHIIVPLDQSRLAESALPLARWLASTSDTEVSLVTVMDAPSSLPDPGEPYPAEHSTEPWDDQRAMRGSLPFGPGTVSAVPSESDLEEVAAKRSEAESYLKRMGAMFAGAHVHTAVLYGEPAEQVLTAARAGYGDSRLGPDEEAAIVMASHGRSGLGRTLLGSVAWNVVRGATAPVFLVRGREDDVEPDAQYGVERVLITLDGSRFAEQIVPAVRHWFGDRLKSLQLMRVIGGEGVWATARDEPRPQKGYTEREEAEDYLSTLSDRLKARGYAVEWDVVQGDVADRVNAVARDSEADIIALSTHGRSGLSRLTVGSVAEQILHRADKPLMVIRPSDDE